MAVDRAEATAGGTTRPDPPARTVVHRVATGASSVAAGLVCGWAVLDPQSLGTATPWIAATGIVLGVPHGAVDHLVPGWAAASWRSRPRRLVVLAIYLGIAGAAFGALHHVPELSFAVFLLVAALHFGWGETTFAAERRGEPVPGVYRGWWPTFAYGAVVIVLPLWSPDARTVLTPLAPGLVAWIAEVPAVGVVAAVVAVSVSTIAWSLLHARAGEAGELAILTTLFLLAPPLAAFGVYFGLWHAVRHTSRLLEVVAPGGGVGRQLVAYVRAAVLPTVAVLAALVLLWQNRGDGVVILAGVSVLLALTFPHVVIVAILDRHRREASVEGRPEPPDHPCPATTHSAASRPSDVSPDQ